MAIARESTKDALSKNETSERVLSNTKYAEQMVESELTQWFVNGEKMFHQIVEQELCILPLIAGPLDCEHEQFFIRLREQQQPPVALLRQHHVPMAVATDCNPGSSPLTSILLAMNMACTLFRLTPEEALTGVTRNAARALGVGNRTIMANNVMLAGHVEVGDGAYLAGAAGFHQFCRIGCYAIVGGQAHIKADVPPYVMVDGKSSSIVGLNRVGLQRNGFSTEEMAELKQAYRLIYRSGLDFAEIQQQLAEQFPAGPAAAYHEFFSGGSRGFVPERKAQRRAGLAIVRPDEPQRETRKAG